MIRAWLVVIIVCAVPRLSSAQGLFLQKGTSGYGGDLGLSTDGGFLSLAADAGYSYEGWLDGSVSISHTSLDRDKTSGYELDAWSIAPRVSVHPLKQSSTMPISVAVAGQFGVFSIGGPVLDERGMTWTGWTAGGGTTIYRFFKLGASYGVIPGLEFTYNHTESTLESSSGATHGSDDLFSVGVGGHGAWLHDSDYIFTLTPAVFIDHRGSVSFSLSVGAIHASL